MMDLIVKCILKTLFKIYNGFCVMVDFSYELFVLVKRSPDEPGFHFKIQLNCTRLNYFSLIAPKQKKEFTSTSVCSCH